MCENKGLTLATIITAEDAQNYKQVLIDQGIFHTNHGIYIIGMHDDSYAGTSEGVWRWDDGTVKYVSINNRSVCIKNTMYYIAVCR